MATCGDCAFFFPIPEADLDFQKGKGDCVMEQQDQKGKFWLSKPVFDDQAACDNKRAAN